MFFLLIIIYVVRCRMRECERERERSIGRVILFYVNNFVNDICQHPLLAPSTVAAADDYGRKRSAKQVVEDDERRGGEEVRGESVGNARGGVRVGENGECCTGWLCRRY